MPRTYTVGSTTFTSDVILFTKPTTPSTDTKSGSCQITLRNIPSHQPYFDMELVFFRSAGSETAMNVTLGVLEITVTCANVQTTVALLNTDGTASKVTEYTGTVTVPVHGVLPSTHLVEWTNGDAVTASYGKIRNLPRTDTPMEEGVSDNVWVHQTIPTVWLVPNG